MTLYFVIFYSAPADYSSVDRILTFTPDVSTLTIPITINPDNIDEVRELFFAVLTMGSSDDYDVQLEPDVANITIISSGSMYGKHMHSICLSSLISACIQMYLLGLRWRFMKWMRVMV